MINSRSIAFSSRGVVMAICIAVLAVALSQTEQAHVSAATTTITFDDTLAPAGFHGTAPLTDQYAALGVTFSGPSAGAGGAVLNQGSGFFVAGVSGPNFLAFNVAEGYPVGPETITFAQPVQRVSIKAGAADEGLAVLAAYDGATMLGVDAVGLSTTVATLEVAFEQITHVMIVFTSQTLVVDDLTWTTGNPPIVNVPDAIVVPNDAGQADAVVPYVASASDAEDGPLTPVCTPPSGSFFPLGQTTVKCSVVDSEGDTGSASFSVTVNDTGAPVVSVPNDIMAEVDQGQNGAIVTYPPATATDNSGAALTPVCTPASGTLFPVGTTTVTCNATDAANNVGSATFTVTVGMPDVGDLLAQLRSDTITYVTSSSAERALVATLDRAIRADDNGNSWEVRVLLLQYVIQFERYEDRGMVTWEAMQQLVPQAQLVLKAIV
jgi:hypothetical protein